jgi:hypothetical protein
MHGLPAPISNMSVRVAGIDTPEIRGHCDAEKQLAIKARDRVLALLAGAVASGQPVLFCRPEWADMAGGLSPMLQLVMYGCKTSFLLKAWGGYIRVKNVAHGARSNLDPDIIY